MIKKFLGLIRSNHKVNLFFKNKERVLTGVFDDLDEAEKTIVNLNNQGYNCYMTLQSINDSILSTNDVKCRNAIKDIDIVMYHYLMIDIDTNKHGEKCASKDEVKQTLAFSKKVIHFILEMTHCHPHVIFTGNGIQLLYPVTLVNNEVNRNLIKSILKSLSILFSDENSHIDQCVFNPARLCRIAGTINWSDYGNSNDISRKNRRSKIIKYGNDTILDVTAFEKMIRIENEKCSVIDGHTEFPCIDVQKTLNKCSVSVYRTKMLDNGKLYALATCPFDYSHKKSSYIIQFKNGYMLFRCFHESCNHTWDDFCTMFQIENTNLKKKAKNKTVDNDMKETTSMRLLNTLLANNHFFSDAKNDCYCQPLELPNKVMNLQSSEFTQYAHSSFYKITGLLAKREDTNTVLPILTSQANENHLKYEIRKRFAFVDGVIYYDLVNANYEFVKISENEITVTDSIGFPLFERTKTMIEQEFTGDVDVSENLLDLLRPHFNLNEDQLFIFAVYLCSLYLDIPCACLIVTGNAGSGKSRLFDLLSRLVNPSTRSLLSMPTKNNDLIVTVSSNPINIFDNLNSSALTQSKSDLMCKIISGNVSESSRRLYTNGETFSYHLRAKILLNGLGLGGLRADLADRCIEIRLKRIDTSKRVDEETLNNAFEEDRDKILQAIFTVLQRMLTVKKEIKPPYKLRLATWSDYSFAIAESIVEGGGEKWLSLVEKSNEEMSINLLEDNPVASSIRSIMNDKKELDISVSDLFKIAKREAISLGFSKEDFPQASHVFSAKMTELEPLMAEQYGITYVKRNVGKCKKLTLYHSKH